MTVGIVVLCSRRNGVDVDVNVGMFALVSKCGRNPAPFPNALIIVAVRVNSIRLCNSPFSGKSFDGATVNMVQGCDKSDRHIDRHSSSVSDWVPNER